MREIFKKKGIFLLLFIVVIFCSKVNAQDNESGGGFNWDGMNDLDNVNVGGDRGSDDAWDHASLYWNTDPNDRDDSTNMGDGYIKPPPPYIPPVPRDPRNPNTDPEFKPGDIQTKSQVILTKTVKPGETHTQSVKVLRDISNSADKKVIDLIVNGVAVGKVTLSAPIKDSNGIDIYSKMTVEVYRHCPIAITNVTFDNPETSNYEGSQHSTNGNLTNALTDLNMYKTLGIINFTTPINDNEDIIFRGSSTVANDSPNNKKDPCLVAKGLTTLSTNPVFQKAVQDIRNRPDFYDKEYSISLGKNSTGQIIAGEMNTGTKSNVEAKHYEMQSFFADFHNHPSGWAHSGFDMYAITVLNTLYPDYSGGFVIPNKEQIYAAVVTDLEAAQNFVAKYLTDPKTKGSQHYPKDIANEMAKVWNDMDSYSIESECRSKAFVLKKYNAGITFYRQNTDGSYYPLIIKETEQSSGKKKYTLIPCS